MPLIAVTSLTGSPGVTATAGALAASWPLAERVLVEADPSGGDLAVDCRLDAHPGLVEVAVRAGDAEIEPHAALAEGVQTARIGGVAVAVVAAPLASVQAAPAIRALARPDSKILTPPEAWVVADCGRAWPTSPSWPLLARADLTVLVVRGTIAQAMNLQAAIPQLRNQCGPRLAIAVVPGHYDADAVHGALLGRGLAVPVLGDLPPVMGLSRPRRSRSRVWRALAERAHQQASRVPIAAIGPAPDHEGGA
ncbi:hypothetical protein GCM10029992_36170 [Glycomyces albus]